LFPVAFLIAGLIEQLPVRCKIILVKRDIFIAPDVQLFLFFVRGWRCKMSDFFKQKRIPADNCVLCDKPFSEVGGRRLVAQQLRGVSLSNRFLEGGNKDYSMHSVKLFDHHEIYLLVWGEKIKWTAEAIERAKVAYLTGMRPWFCQCCGHRQCRVCNLPINYPMGSDVLNDVGCSSHIPVLPFDPGCSNQECKNYKEFSL